jgi:hypothetical protein
MKPKLSGGCLCDAVHFSVKNEFKAFFQCHCKQCQKLTGSVFTSNILSAPRNIEWLKGTSNVTVYNHPTRGFSKSFCNICGSGLPFINKNKTTLIIPAGSLNELPDLQPQANMFTSEEACWLKPGLNAKDFIGFPE